MIPAIPYHDFGGKGPLLHFAHSNGYPPACFQQLITPLLPHYRVLAVYHRPLWPETKPADISSWYDIADDMIRFFDQKLLQGVIGLGHSLGAVTSLLAAQKRPDLFRALVLIEPTILPPAMLEMMRDNPQMIQEVPIVQKAWKRRFRWPNRQAAFAHFRSKPVFAGWSDAAIWAYLNNGLQETDNKEVTLAYSREWEGHIYTLTPTDVWEYVAQNDHPTVVIRGEHSDVFRPEALKLWRERQPEVIFEEINNAGHMVPMERPLVTAQIILNTLQNI